MKIDTLLIATGNTGKFKEIKQELEDLPIGKIIYLKDLGEYPECEENGKTFEENAELKARFYAKHFGYITLADDSGLEVDCLGGKPGVYSARYAGQPCNDDANNQKLIEEIKNIPFEKRTARFRCVMVLADPKENILGKAEGIIEGLILDEPRGKNGFGYDPLFYVPTLRKTTAEISRQEKNKISHRGQATRKIKEIIKTLLQDD